MAVCGEVVVVCVDNEVFRQSISGRPGIRQTFDDFFEIFSRWQEQGRFSFEEVKRKVVRTHLIFMPDRKRKPERTTPHKDKICKTCGRAFEWRKRWEKDWDVIKYCSDACRGHQPGVSDDALEASILELLAERGREKTICPSEAAKAVGGDEERRDWEGLMEPARAAARRLVAKGKIVITQHGQVVDPSSAKGPIRLRLR